MAPNKQIITACWRRAAVVTALFAVHTLLALHTPAQAQTIAPVAAPALFVAPQLIPVAAPAGAPAAVPALAHPAPADETKHAAVPPAAAAAPATSIACNTPFEFSRFDRPLLRTMRRLTSGKPLTIVAIGSSSTAGAGASSPDASYPSRLAAELKQRFPAQAITVLNRGVNGEETDNMMARFSTDVIAAHPQLVLWQVGTNSVLRDRPLAT